MKKIYTALFVSILMATNSFGATYDKNDTLEQAKLKVNSTDCSKDLMECRYYAAIEYVAFNNACFGSFKDKFNADILEKDKERAKKALENWTAMSDPAMREAVLSADNVLRKTIEKEMMIYLKQVPSDEWAIECSRIALIEQNKNPEEMSDIVQGTLNYKDWIKIINAK